MFKRLAVAAALVAVVGTSAPAHAAGRVAPRLTFHGFVLGGTGPEGEQEYELVLEAFDPDGVIWEVQVYWGDQSITFAHTYCVQGTEPGTRAPMRIPHTYPEPGTYRARVQVTSYSTCPWLGGEPAEQHSRWYTKRLTLPAS